MTDTANNDMAACRRGCWIAAALFGIAIMGVAQALTGWFWILSLIVGLIAAGVIGWFLPNYFCVGAGDARVSPPSGISSETAREEVAVNPGAATAFQAEHLSGEADSRQAPVDASATEAAARASGWSGTGAAMMRKPGADGDVGAPGQAKYAYTPQPKPERPARAAAPAEPAAEAGADAEAVPEAPAAPRERPVLAPVNMPQGHGARDGSGWGGTGGSLSRKAVAGAAAAEGALSAEEAAADAAEARAAAMDAAAARGEMVATPTTLADDVDDAGVHNAPLTAQEASADADAAEAMASPDGHATDMAASGDGSDAAHLDAAGFSSVQADAPDDSVTPSELASAVDEAGTVDDTTTPSALVGEVTATDDPVTPSELADAVEEDDTPRVTPSELTQAVEAGAPESEPRLYDARPADVDNLKEIKGVGAGLEKTLNDLGIYTFAQVSEWGAGEIAWVDARLKFKGRITRDKWVDQARILAAGGETDFSRRVDEGDVY